MFVDASAIVAIIAGEPEAARLARTLDAAAAPITSPIAIYEATLALARSTRGGIAQAGQDVRDFLAAAGIRTVPITDAETDAALDAFSRYGKGRRHPAQLNLGDCFAYAMAKTHATALLFKGNDFSRTDIAAA